MNQAWPTKRLADVCQILGGATPSKKNPKFYGGDIPWATVGDMNVEVITTTEEYITKAAVADCSTNIIPSGSIVMATRVGLGKVCVLGQDTAINQDLKGLTPKNTKELTTRWLFWWLKSKASDIQKAGTGATVQGVKMTFVQELEIPLPPLSEQKRIVALLDEAFAGIDAAKAKADSCITDAEESFNSLIDSKISCASEGAPCVALEELCDKNRVITYGVIKLGEPTRDGVYCLRCGNLKRLTIDLEGIRKIPDSLSKEYSRTVLKGGELLVNVRGTLGGVCVAPSSMSGWNVAREIAVVPLQPGAISAEYLSYHVASTTSQAWLMGKRKGAAYVGINIEDIRRLPIYLPSRKEQERIAGVLSEAQRHALDLQNIYEKKAKKLLDLKSSLLTQAFAGELTA